jgi:hypothetical protein
MIFLNKKIIPGLKNGASVRGILAGLCSDKRRKTEKGLLE